jgi:hypothetical protein
MESGLGGLGTYTYRRVSDGPGALGGHRRPSAGSVRSHPGCEPGARLECPPAGPRDRMKETSARQEHRQGDRPAAR